MKVFGGLLAGVLICMSYGVSEANAAEKGSKKSNSSIKAVQKEFNISSTSFEVKKEQRAKFETKRSGAFFKEGSYKLKAEGRTGGMFREEKLGAKSGEFKEEKRASKNAYGWENKQALKHGGHKAHIV